LWPGGSQFAPFTDTTIQTEQAVLATT